LLPLFYFSFAVFDRFELLRNVYARQMGLIVNVPENMKGRTPSWSKQRIPTHLGSGYLLRVSDSANLANRTRVNFANIIPSVADPDS
jgi:hypothetical protein